MLHLKLVKDYAEAHGFTKVDALSILSDIAEMCIDDGVHNVAVRDFLDEIGFETDYSFDAFDILHAVSQKKI